MNRSCVARNSDNVDHQEELDNEPKEFCNPLFKRGGKDLLHQIKRKAGKPPEGDPFFGGSPTNLKRRYSSNGMLILLKKPGSQL